MSNKIIARDAYLLIMKAGAARIPCVFLHRNYKRNQGILSREGNYLDNVNNFMMQILNSKVLCEEFCGMVEDDDTYIYNHYDGNIEEKLLIDLIEKSKKEHCYEHFLSALSICLRKEEVTPKVFKLLLSLKGRFRESILIGLAHCKLSYYQLIELNKLHIDEALSQLLEICIKFDCFSQYDLFVILQEWKNIPPIYIIENILEKYGKTEKGEWLKGLLSDGS